MGFLDGGPGFAHIAIGCNNTFQKYLKLIELQNAQATQGGEVPSGPVRGNDRT
jgi:hypothetical protein